MMTKEITIWFLVGVCVGIILVYLLMRLNDKIKGNRWE